MNKNLSIAIAGGGVEGLAAARYFSLHGYRNIAVFDEKESLTDSLPEGVKFYGGAAPFKESLEYDFIIRSPGVPMEKFQIPSTKFQKKSKIQNPKSKQKQKKLQATSYDLQAELTSTTQYFLEHCPCPVIGVSGTKGKGTTSTLIYLMLKEAGRDVYLGGNIGQSPFDFLDKLHSDSVVVLEMSSFQLQDIRLSPHIAVMLGVTSDHLDYHKDVEEYREAKSGLVRFQKPEDFAIFNQDYEVLKRYADITPAKKLFVSTRTPVHEGAYLRGNKIVVTLLDKKKIVNVEILEDITKIALLGSHHLENVLPAVTVAKLLDVPVTAMQKVLYSFTGLPHRLEFVREVKGVKYYDDSISTTPETSIAATYAFQNKEFSHSQKPVLKRRKPSVRVPIILIAGGSEKGADYTDWGVQLQKNPDLKMVILIGREDSAAVADRMEKALRDAAQTLEKGNSMSEFPLKIYRATSMDDAVVRAHDQGRAGDVVVLSPAAASFDMFKNYKERGEKFAELVGKLA